MNKYESISNGEGVYIETLDSIVDRIHDFAHFLKNDISLISANFAIREEDGCKYLDCDFVEFRIGITGFQTDFLTLEVI